MEMGRKNEMKLNETVNLQMKMLSGLVLKVNELFKLAQVYQS